MSMAFVFRCLMVSLANPWAHVLSVMRGVGGCLCPISSSVTLMTAPSCPLWKVPAISTSAALETMVLRMREFMWIGAFRGGDFWMVVKWKYPAIVDLDLGSVKYDPSLCI